jgi:hypothetical protein
VGQTYSELISRSCRVRVRQPFTHSHAKFCAIQPQDFIEILNKPSTSEVGKTAAHLLLLCNVYVFATGLKDVFLNFRANPGACLTWEYE